MFSIRLTEKPLGDDVLSHLDSDEAAGAKEVSERPDTLALSILNTSSGKPVGYAVFGKDEGDILAIYYARSFVPGVGAMVMKQFLGVGRVFGTPVRVHSNNLRELYGKAKLMGAALTIEAEDADGLLTGVHL